MIINYYLLSWINIVYKFIKKYEFVILDFLLCQNSSLKMYIYLTNIVLI